MIRGVSQGIKEVSLHATHHHPSTTLFLCTDKGQTYIRCANVAQPISRKTQQQGKRWRDGVTTKQRQQLKGQTIVKFHTLFFSTARHIFVNKTQYSIMGAGGWYYVPKVCPSKVLIKRWIRETSLLWSQRGTFSFVTTASLTQKLYLFIFSSFLLGLDPIWWMVGKPKIMATQHWVCCSRNCNGSDLSIYRFRGTGTKACSTLSTHSFTIVV